MRRSTGIRAAGQLGLAVLVLGSSAARAQEPGQSPIAGEVFADSEFESYLRFLQSQGKVPLYPWSVRSFSRAEVDRLLPADSAHPWARHFAFEPDTAVGFRWRAIRPDVRLIYNSAFPHGSNDGAIWAGRGLTVAAQAGFTASAGPVSLTVAPVLFHAQNADFELTPTEAHEEGKLIYADPRSPFINIDLPQRFGPDPYTRVDPGQSTLRVDLPIVAVGVSTANQYWGPASDNPLLLGTNAAGFPHLFLGTSAPINVGLGHIHGRLTWGILSQSEYSPIPEDSLWSRRLMSGFVAAFQPRGLSGLELGVGRFYHTPWPSEGLTVARFVKPLQSFLKSRLPDSDVPANDNKQDIDNQIASAFARWVLPSSGFEVYGEYAREDYNWDLRDFLLEPDQGAAYMLGFRQAWTRPDGSFLTLRGEVLNAEINHLHIVRTQAPFYVHSWTRQGHTQRGQILGSPGAYGGAAGVLGVDRYHENGRWTVEWTRQIRIDRFPEIWGNYSINRDSFHTLGGEVVAFRGKWEVAGGLTGVYEINRHFRDEDAFNLAASLRVKRGL